MGLVLIIFCSAAQRRNFDDLEARRIKLSHVNDAVGIADGLSGIATNIANAVKREIEARRVKLSHVNDAVGIVDGLTGIATNIAGYVDDVYS